MRPNMRPMEKTDLKGALRSLTVYLQKSLGVILLALVLAALSAVLTIIGPDQVGKIATLMSEGLVGGIDLAAVARVGVLLAVIYGLSALFGFIQHYIMASVTLKMSYRMRGELSEKINRVPQKYFNFHAQGDILSRITNDVSTLQQGLTNSLPTIISRRDAVYRLPHHDVRDRVASGAGRAGHHAGGAPADGAHHVPLAEVLYRPAGEPRRAERLCGGDVFRPRGRAHLPRRSARSRRRSTRMNDAVYDANWRSPVPLRHHAAAHERHRQPVAMSPCACWGRSWPCTGIIDIGVIVSFILYVRLFTSPLTQIAQGMTNLQTASASAHRIFDFLASEELPDERTKPQLPRPIRGAVDFEHVRFSYPDSPDKIIIKDFSAHVAPGQKVAIVGPTGAGKTTMVNLLMRFYELTDGCIKIDGVPTTDIQPRGRAAACSAWCCRTRGCLRARSAKTSSTTSPA